MDKNGEIKFLQGKLKQSSLEPFEESPKVVSEPKTKAKAKAKAANLKPLLDRINSDGSLSLNKIAEILNRERIPTVSGKGCWNSRLVGRVYERLEAA